MRKLARFEWLLAASPEEAAGRFSAVSKEEREALRTGLISALGDEERAFDERLAAGAVLAVGGDPRIDPLEPPMVTIPPGEFGMGMDRDEVVRVAREFDLPEVWLETAVPRHRVRLDAYEIGRFPVTQAEWAFFLAETGHPERPPDWSGPRPPLGRENHPVWGLSWEAALTYTQWLTRRTGRRYRIPTEAEWERAARGNDARAYPWGDAFDPSRANTREIGVGTTTPIGMFPSGASPFDLLDCGGNVEEFTASLLLPYPDGDPAVFPEPHRVTRGGCFRLDGDLARCDRRHGPQHGGAVGFRLARSRSRLGAIRTDSELGENAP